MNNAGRMIEWNTALRYIDITNRVATMPKLNNGNTKKFLQNSLTEAKEALKDQYYVQIRRISGDELTDKIIETEKLLKKIYYIKDTNKKLAEQYWEEAKQNFDESVLNRMIEIQKINEISYKHIAKDWINKGILRGVKNETTRVSDGISRQKKLFEILG